MASALAMLRRCGQHQADGAAPHHYELEPVQSHDREAAPTGAGESLDPSDVGFADVLRYVMQGEADEQVTRLNARG